MGIFSDNYYIDATQTHINSNPITVDDVAELVGVVVESKDRVDISLKEYESMKEELKYLRNKHIWHNAKIKVFSETLTDILGFKCEDNDPLDWIIKGAYLDRDVMHRETDLIVKFKVEEK